MSQVETIQLTPLTADVVQKDEPILPADPIQPVDPINADPHSSAKAASIIGILTGTTFVGSIGTGLVTIALPAIARDLALPAHLLLWLVTTDVAVQVLD